MSKKEDLTGIGNVFSLEDGNYAVCAHGFMPEEGVDRHRKTDRVPYWQWISEGWCSKITGAVIDIENLKNHIIKTEKENEWKTAELCFDCLEKHLAI